MSISNTPISADRTSFAGVVAGIDVAKGVSAADAASIEAGMDHYAVLVLPDQTIDDDQQYAFSQHFGPWRWRPATSPIASSAGFR